MGTCRIEKGEKKGSICLPAMQPGPNSQPVLPVDVSGRRDEDVAFALATGQARGEAGSDMPMQAGATVPGWGPALRMPAHKMWIPIPYPSDGHREDRSAT